MERIRNKESRAALVLATAWMFHFATQAQVRILWSLHDRKHLRVHVINIIPVAMQCCQVQRGPVVDVHHTCFPFHAS